MTKNENNTNRFKGFFGSIGLAFKIATGSLKLFWRFPKLILPLLPIFVLALLTLFSLVLVSNLVMGFLIVFALAFALMFSFAITGQMLAQIERDEQPSIINALTASATVRMIPRVFAVSAIWYVLVLILVAIETAVRAVAGRISDNIADGILNFIFGAIADALRMAGFMLVAIMTFENIGLRPALSRLRAVTTDNPITILGGLALTKFVGFISFLAIMFLPESLGLFTTIILALLWMLGMYLEQLFVTGLYLYTTAPDSRLVEILLKDFVGAELPELPRLSEQPLV